MRPVHPALCVAASILFAMPALAIDVPCSTGGDAAGWAVATGADFDGDGVADVAVASPCARVVDARNAGKVAVYSGADGTRLVVVKGAQPGQRFGGAIAFVGDLSGDGLADLVVGSRGFDAPREGGGKRNDAGRVEVFARDGSSVMAADGLFAGGAFGEAVAGLTDVTGDTVPDLLVGAGSDRTGPGGEKVGVAYILSGADGVAVDSSIGNLQFDEWGRVVGAASDVDGDGVDDVIVASNLADAITAASTTTTLPPTTTLAPTSTSTTTSTTLAAASTVTVEPNNGIVRILSGADMSDVLVEVGGELPEDKLGRSVAMCADMNGDGVDDFFAGAPGANPAGVSKAGSVTLFASTGEPLATFVEPTPQGGAGFGTAVAALGLVDDDDKTDIVASAPTANVGPLVGAGRVHAMSGDSGAALWTLDGWRSDLRLGQALAGGPDWNGDGVPDAVVGIPGDAPAGRRGAGTARLLSGADGSELERFTGRRGLETRIFTVGRRAGGAVEVRSLAASGRRHARRRQVFRRLRSGELSIAVLDDALDPDPGRMRLVVGAGHGADDKSVKVIRAGRRGTLVSDFSVSFSGPYDGGVNVAAGDLEELDGGDIAAVQADSDDGNVNLVLFRRFDTDPLRGIVSWLAFDSFDVFDPGTTIDTFKVAAEGATIAVGDVRAGGRDEIVAGPVRGVPVVRVFSNTGNLHAQWPAYPPGVNSGTSVAVGDLDGDGLAEIVTGPYIGNARIKAFTGQGAPFVDDDSGAAVDFFALSPGFTDGVRVAVADVDLDGEGEILVSPTGTGEILAFEPDGSAVDGWRDPQPYGPAGRRGFALSTTDRFLRHR